ncbi:hypothetical protein LX64_04931 [Chitinophaga skermanii]|uniref:N-acetyltransferase domain-containing protein n=1 Tax=Chitinophaga skermanii TaxID=331697 RepID=A0A327Q2E1_9BACT|nr:GNAT family N-acetyltransferase [Chitinophaga skermanii]RAI97881.1 hypothetical protein LX64_04931 [Chitinophaga skermanii]
MKDEYVSLPLVKNEAKEQFELTVDGYTAFIVYKEKGTKTYLIHTEAPPELEGKGVATALIEKTLAYLEEHHHTLVPLCPLVAAYIKRHPDWERIVDPSVKND